MNFQDIKQGQTFIKQGQYYTPKRDVQRDQFSISNGLKVLCYASDGELVYVLGTPFEVVMEG